MPEDVIAKLTQFTPTTGLDRDELLFRAGRASAPSVRKWKFVAYTLVVTQCALLAFWLTQPPPTIPPVVEDRIPIHFDEPSSPIDPDSYGALMQSWDGDALPPASRTDDSAPVRPPLSVRTAWTGTNID